MFTVALIGPDGAGKSTVSRQLPDRLPLPAKTIYMGINLESTELMLPTTRLVRAIRHRRDAGFAQSKSSDFGPGSNRYPPLLATAKGSFRSGARLINWVSEEWFRQAIASFHKYRGKIVIFDRHFFPDYYMSDIVETVGHRPLARRIHGWLLANIYPKPDLVIYLDVPAEELFRRKQEGTVESLERRRQDYVQMGSLFRRFVVVDAGQPLDDVTHSVAREICDFYEENRMPTRRWGNKHRR